MDQFVYIGTITTTQSQGIYGMMLTDDGCSVPKLMAEVPSPTYLCINRNHTFLYAVGEPEKGPGRIHVYRIESGTHELKLQQSIETPSLGLCHVTLSPDERYLLTTSYNDATIQVYSVGPDGSIGVLTQFYQRIGHGPNEERQNKAHTHSIWFTPDGKYVLVCDLGTDQILFYTLNNDGTLTEHPELHTKVPAGYGPRHLVFHPSKPIAYIAAEITDHVLVYAYDPVRGLIFMQDELSSVTGDPANTSSAIRISKDGRHLYVSNRGEDSITLYEVDGSGMIHRKERIGVQGRTPRDFQLDLTERYLICGGQDSDTTTVFLRNTESGVLRPILTFDKIAKPVAIQYIPDIKG